ncbi:hypothetical protein HDA40_000753 [Hamadaea flava]|nr:hypothetical protein [Hamadaea flava]
MLTRFPAVSARLVVGLRRVAADSVHNGRSPPGSAIFGRERISLASAGYAIFEPARVPPDGLRRPGGTTDLLGALLAEWQNGCCANSA